MACFLQAGQAQLHVGAPPQALPGGEPPSHHAIPGQPQSFKKSHIHSVRVYHMPLAIWGGRFAPFEMIANSQVFNPNSNMAGAPKPCRPPMWTQAWLSLSLLLPSISLCTPLNTPLPHRFGRCPEAPRVPDFHYYTHRYLHLRPACSCCQTDGFPPPVWKPVAPSLPTQVPSPLLHDQEGGVLFGL